MVIPTPTIGGLSPGARYLGSLSTIAIKEGRSQDLLEAVAGRA